MARGQRGHIAVICALLFVKFPQKGIVNNLFRLSPGRRSEPSLAEKIYLLSQLHFYYIIARFSYKKSTFFQNQRNNEKEYKNHRDFNFSLLYFFEFCVPFSIDSFQINPNRRALCKMQILSILTEAVLAY